MAKVKIFLDKNETIEDAEELLKKALELHSTGDIHVDESWDDPAMVDVQDRAVEVHKRIYDDMIDEIINAINEEY